MVASEMRPQRPTFIDHHPAFNASGYTITNEEPKMFTKLLDGVEGIKLAGGICSGGEVPLQVLLPLASEAVYAIDHGLKALAVTYLKAVMLAQLGPKAFKALFVEKVYQDFKKAMTEAHKELLPALAKEIVTDGYYLTFDSTSFNLSLKREWGDEHGPSEADLELAFKKLDKLTLIHGDLTDLKDVAPPLDVLYISNACGHSGRSKSYPKPDQFAPLVREDGLMLSVEERTSTFWESVKKDWGSRSCWTHTLYKKRSVVPDTARGLTT